MIGQKKRFLDLWVAGLFVFSILVLPDVALANDSGLQPGTKIPVFHLKDQKGQLQSFDSLKGPNGLVILFNRSADWCPFCKAQMIDLEGARKNFEAQGVHVVTITYDSPAILKTFAERRNLHFTLLSDPDSKTIEAFGIRNPEAQGTEAGIPIPNYYLIGANGVIRNRHAETNLLDRITASYFYESIYGTRGALLPTSGEVPHTPHVKITTGQSDKTSAPGSRIRLTVHVSFDPGTHLYAAGADKMGYRSVKLILAPSKLYLASPVGLPPSTLMKFPAPLNESVPVFQKDITLTEDVTAVRSPDSIALFSNDPNLTIHGDLEYQACTKVTCFPPTSVPVSWTLLVNPSDLDAIRVPERLQRR